MRQYIRRGDFRENIGMFAEQPATEFEYEGDDDSLKEEIASIMRNLDLAFYLPALSAAIGGHAYAHVESQIGFTITRNDDGVYELERHHLYELANGEHYTARMSKYPGLREERAELVDMVGDIVKVASSDELDIYRSTDRYGAPASYWLGDETGNESLIDLYRAYEIILMNADTMKVNASAGNVWSMLAAMVQARQNYIRFDSDFLSDNGREFSVLRFMDLKKVFDSFADPIGDH